jgi:hypothetical protein
MKNKRPLMLLLLACCLAQPVLGQTLFGNFDCGQWISAKSDTHKAWLLGYMSGLNAVTNPDSRKKIDWLDKVNSAEQIYLFADNYCRANPLRKIESAGLKLYLELVSK